MNNEPNESPPVPGLLVTWRLEKSPLAIACEITGLPTLRLPLPPATAQMLALAILAQPEVGYNLFPEAREIIAETAREFAERDEKFLSEMGVCEQRLNADSAA